jgi:hypothetical protein
MAFMFELIGPRGLYTSAADVHPINLKQLCHRSALIVTEQSLTYLVPSHFPVGLDSVYFPRRGSVFAQLSVINHPNSDLRSRGVLHLHQKKDA